MSTSGNGRIPIPWSQRWRWIRLQALPVLTFAACIFAGMWLWSRQVGLPGAIGEVYAVRIDLTSQVDGLLADTPYRRMQLFDRVAAGDVVMRLDDRPVRAALETLGKSLNEAKAELVKAEEQLRIDEADRAVSRLSEVRRRAIRVEEVRLLILTTRTELETDRVELQRLSEQEKIIRDVYQRNAITRLDYINIQLQRDRIAQRVVSNENVLQEAQEQLARSLQQMNEFTATQTAEAAKLLAPVRAAIEVQEASIRELELQVRSLEIHAPIDGTIAAVMRYPGQAVRAGDPIATLAAEDGQFIISYVRQHQRWQPAAGTMVEVRLRTSPSKVIEAYVDRIGPQVEIVPPHQLRDPRLPEWGLPVRIVLANATSLRPGELVDLKFRPTAKRAAPENNNPPPGGSPEL